MTIRTLTRSAACAIATAALLIGGSALPAVAAEEAEYIISVPDGQVAPLVTDLSQLGESPDHVYTSAIDGVAVSLTPAEVSAIQAENPQAQIVPDSIVTISATRSGSTWGLSALDQATAPADSSYTYPDSAGTGVDVFVIDTGVANRPADFGGTLDTTRARDFTGLGTWVDCNGHGTHVAGTVASNVYGVASKATIIPIRVLDCNGSGSMSNVLAGVNYAMSAKTPGKTAVLNMSLGGGYAAYLNAAVDAAVDAGIVSVVAAGNSSVDACGSSPASAPKALTVGALSNNLSPAGFSNYGSCVDVYAPGAGITSLWLGTSTATISGTSMASPHAAGVAALYIAANPTQTAAQVTAAIFAASKVNCGACSPNKTLNIQNLALNPTQPPVTPPAPVVPGAPGAPTLSNVTATSSTVSWTAPSTDGGSAITSYLVEYRAATATTWQSVTVTAPTRTTTVASLLPNTNYTYRVTARNSVGSSPASSTANAQTLTSVPGTPGAPTLSNVTATSTTVSWTTPSTDGGSAITSYLVQYRAATATTWQSVTVTAPTTSATVTALSRNTTYTYRVTARNSLGSSLASATTSARTLTGIPTAPRNVFVSSVGTTATVSWTAPSSTNGAPLTAYRVEYRKTPSSAWQSRTVSSVSGATPATTVNITGLAPRSMYQIRVIAQSQFGSSAPASGGYTVTTTIRKNR
jgi:subtilisin family serine protease